MKTKEEIIKMLVDELLAEKREIKLKENSDCSDCSDCYACINIKRKQYMICNVQFTKEEYEAKMKELKETK